MVGDLNFRIHNYSMPRESSTRCRKYMKMIITQGIMIPIYHRMMIHLEVRISYSNLSGMALGVLGHVEALIADRMKQCMCNEQIKQHR